MRVLQLTASWFCFTLKSRLKRFPGVNVPYLGDENPILRHYIFPFLPLKTLCARLDHSRAGIEHRHSQWEYCIDPKLIPVHLKTWPGAVSAMSHAGYRHFSELVLVHVVQCCITNDHEEAPWHWGVNEILWLIMKYFKKILITTKNHVKSPLIM